MLACLQFLFFTDKLLNTVSYVSFGTHIHTVLYGAHLGMNCWVTESGKLFIFVPTCCPEWVEQFTAILQQRIRIPVIPLLVNTWYVQHFDVSCLSCSGRWAGSSPCGFNLCFLRYRKCEHLLLQFHFWNPCPNVLPIFGLVVCFFLLITISRSSLCSLVCALF